MRVRFWGTRGSLPSPGPATVQFGGNTSCVEVRTDQTLVVLDCGTGARNLGQALVRDGAPVEGHILLSHAHWDHIQGFPFFAPLLTPGNHFALYSAQSGGCSLRDVLAGQMEYPYFPIKLTDLKSPALFHEIAEETMALGDVRVASQFLNHTALTLGYRLENDGASVVYATDTEPFGSFQTGPAKMSPAHRFRHEGDRRFVAFAHGADVLIHDAQYTSAEYGKKAGWGHSPLEYAVEVALAAQVKQLVLFHHDIDRTDDQVRELVWLARYMVAERGATMQVDAAAEGWEMTVEATPVCSGAAPVRRKILVAEDDPGVSSLLNQTFSGRYEIFLAEDGEDALEKALRIRPDLILTDLVMPKLDAYQLTERLRETETMRLVPIIVVTGQANELQETHGFEIGVTDFVRKPFALAQLEARVEMWFERQERSKMMAPLATDS